MELDPTACYRALSARDARYDGRFFVAVRTTGIYCRPICPARTPKAENCIFMRSAAAAQEAGFRPCLRCKPERAPDSGAWRGSSTTVTRALALIEAGALDHGDVDKLAARLGMGERQLRRLFRQHLGAAPISVAQTRRVLLAKQLVHDTDMPMTAVALASGYGSLRRFNEAFQRLYRRPPSELRRRRAVATPGSGLTLRLPYRPPYDWPSMQAALGFSGQRYRRRIALAGAAGTVEVAHAAELSALLVTVRFPQLRALPAIIARVRRLFDLAADPEAITAVLARDPVLAPLVAARPGLRVPGRWAAPADGDVSPRAHAALPAGAERWRPWQAYALAHLQAAGVDAARVGQRESDDEATRTSRPGALPARLGSSREEKQMDGVHGSAAADRAVAAGRSQVWTRLRCARRSSPIGEMLLAWDDDDQLHVLDFADCGVRTRRLLGVRYGAVELVAAAAPAAIERALDAYFAGVTTALDALPVASVGTPFQRAVWSALRGIPAGTTTSYGQLAAALGRDGASRAVGTANGANLVALVVPCHRVIGADGTPTGYAGGLARKRWLLAHEGVAGWKEEAA